MYTTENRKYRSQFIFGLEIHVLLSRFILLGNYNFFRLTTASLLFFLSFSFFFFFFFNTLVIIRARCVLLEARRRCEMRNTPMRSQIIGPNCDIFWGPGAPSPLLQAIPTPLITTVSAHSSLHAGWDVAGRREGVSGASGRNDVSLATSSDTSQLCQTVLPLDFLGTEGTSQIWSWTPTRGSCSATYSVEQNWPPIWGHPACSTWGQPAFMSDTSACQVRWGRCLLSSEAWADIQGLEQDLLCNVGEKSSSFQTDSQQCHFLVWGMQIFSFLPQSAGAWLYILTLPWAEQAEKTDMGLTDMINLGGHRSWQMERKINCFTSGRRDSEAFFAGRVGCASGTLMLGWNYQ